MGSAENVSNLIANSGFSNTSLISASDAVAHLEASLNVILSAAEPGDFSMTLTTEASTYQRDVYLLAGTEYFFTVTPAANASIFDFASQRISLTPDTSTQVDIGLYGEYWGDQQAYSTNSTFMGRSELAFMPATSGLYTLTFRGSNDIVFASPAVSKTFDVKVTKDTSDRPGYGTGFSIAMAGATTFTGVLQSPLDQDVFQYTPVSVLDVTTFSVQVTPDAGEQG